MVVLTADGFGEVAGSSLPMVTLSVLGDLIVGVAGIAAWVESEAKKMMAKDRLAKIEIMPVSEGPINLFI